jgi:hypothetical protein
MREIACGTVRGLTADPLALPYIDTASIRPASVAGRPPPAG